MATISRFLALSRTLFTRQTLTLISSSTSSSLSRLRIVATALHRLPAPSPAFSGDVRPFCTRQWQSSLDDGSLYGSNRLPEGKPLEGCDFEHWLVVTDPPRHGATRDEIIDSYINALAQVVGSEEEARMKIYSVSTKHYYALGALVPEELALKLRDVPIVRWVLPDSYLDAENKDYGGEPFINGKAVPYDPKYHEEWVRNNQKANRRHGRSRKAGSMGGPEGAPSDPPNTGSVPNESSGAPNPGCEQNMALTNNPSDGQNS